MDTQTAILIGIIGTAIYYTIYKKNRLFGNLAFLTTAVGIMMDADTNIQNMMAIVLMLAIFTNLLYDLFRKTPMK